MVFFSELFELFVVVGDEVVACAEGGDGVCDGKEEFG
jgi:hypothetical protein